MFTESQTGRPYVLNSDAYDLLRAVAELYAVILRRLHHIPYLRVICDVGTANGDGHTFFHPRCGCVQIIGSRDAVIHGLVAAFKS